MNWHPTKEIKKATPKIIPTKLFVDAINIINVDKQIKESICQFHAAI